MCCCCRDSPGVHRTNILSDLAVVHTFTLISLDFRPVVSFGLVFVFNPFVRVVHSSSHVDVVALL